MKWVKNKQERNPTCVEEKCQCRLGNNGMLLNFPISSVSVFFFFGETKARENLANKTKEKSGEDESNQAR